MVENSWLTIGSWGVLMKRIFLSLVVLLAAQNIFAGVMFTDLGTAAPPATVGGYHVTAFDQAPQVAISNFTDVTLIPGSPVSGDLTTNLSVNKREIGAGWATWSHGYTGVVYYTNGSNTVTLTLPPTTGAFYLYAEPNQFAEFTISATTDSGISSGPISVVGASGANGFAFHTTAGDQIKTITVTTTDNDMAVGEFGIAATIPAVPVPTLSEWSLVLLTLMFLAIATFVMWRRNLAI